MSFLLTIILTVQMLAALGMIGLILIQHGKGADMGAAFGSGSSGSLFGASGSANFLSRTTAILAAVFFSCTLALAYFGNVRPASSGSVLERAAGEVPAVAQPQGPADQIPKDSAAAVPAAAGAAAPAVAPAAAPAQPATPAPAAAGGAAQIPGK